MNADTSTIATWSAVFLIMLSLSAYAVVGITVGSHYGAEWGTAAVAACYLLGRR